MTIHLFDAQLQTVMHLPDVQAAFMENPIAEQHATSRMHSKLQAPEAADAEVPDADALLAAYYADIAEINDGAEGGSGANEK